jgi:hypothetical protein
MDGRHGCEVHERRQDMDEIIVGPLICRESWYPEEPKTQNPRQMEKRQQLNVHISYVTEVKNTN